jgi:hypothetical protein
MALDGSEEPSLTFSLSFTEETNIYSSAIFNHDVKLISLFPYSYPFQELRGREVKEGR